MNAELVPLSCETCDYESVGTCFEEDFYPNFHEIREYQVLRCKKCGKWENLLIKTEKLQ